MVEGELGYIGGSSQVLRSLPAGAAIRPEDLTRPEDAVRFVKETGIDLLAPAVGNIHGIVMGIGNDGKLQSINPKLDIERIAAIKKALRRASSSAKASADKQDKSVPLVLHGGSGISDGDFVGYQGCNPSDDTCTHLCDSEDDGDRVKLVNCGSECSY